MDVVAACVHVILQLHSIGLWQPVILWLHSNGQWWEWPVILLLCSNRLTPFLAETQWVVIHVSASHSLSHDFEKL